MAQGRPQQGACFLFIPVKEHTDQEHGRHPQQAGNNIQLEAIVNENQAEMCQMGKRESGTVDNQGCLFSKRPCKARMNQTAKEKLFPYRAEGHADRRHDDKHDHSIGTLKAGRDVVRFGNVHVPISIRQSIHKLPGIVKNHSRSNAQ